MAYPDLRQTLPRGANPRGLRTGPKLLRRGRVTVPKRKSAYRSFAAARDYVRALELTKVQDYWDWCKGEDRARPPKPDNIPSNPHQVYKKEWTSFSDFLGTKRVANFNREFLPFEKAREFAQALCLGSINEWEEYACGRLHVAGMSPRPANIPSNPNFTYKLTGWVGFPDWLGYGAPREPQLSRFIPFVEARDYARSLKLSGWLEWRALVRRKDLPANIPTSPHSAYRGEGWVDYGDWLGTGQTAYHQVEFKPFNEARAFVRTLGLKDLQHWRDYCSGRLPELPAMPADIPSNPDKSYPREWRGMQDWLTEDPAPYHA